MPNYTLCYWAVPFRGQFVRALLAYGGEAWTEAGDEAVGALMEGRWKTCRYPSWDLRSWLITLQAWPFPRLSLIHI